MVENTVDLLRRMQKRIEESRMNKMYSEYPCVDYLHNALKFIETKQSDAAYEEVCHAIIRSRAKLTAHERDIFDAIRYNHSITKSCQIKEIKSENLPDPSWARDDE